MSSTAPATHRIPDSYRQANHLPYKSIISPRSSSVTRAKMVTTSNNNSPAAGSSSFIGGYGGAGLSAFSSGLPFSVITPTKSISGSSLREYREKEKKELIELNDRFANYVERVRFLEAQNKHLKTEADALKGQLGTDNSKIKELYDAELLQARDVIASTGKDHMILEAKVLKAEDEAKFYRSRYEDLLTTYKCEQEKLHMMATEMSDNQATINLMNRRMKDLDDELKHYKTESQKLLQEVQSMSSELFGETSTRLQLQNEKQSLEEELNFLKQVHAQELDDIQHRQSLKEQSIDPSVFFRHELSNAIKDIREEYDALHQQQRGEMENWYRLRLNNAIQEFQSTRIQEQGVRGQKPKDDEIKNLHEQVKNFRRENTAFKQKIQEQECAIDELRSVVHTERNDRTEDLQNRDEVITNLKLKLEDLLADYEDLASNNNNLNSEISIYRKLLEGSDNSDGLRQIAEGIERQAKNDWSQNGITGLLVKNNDDSSELTKTKNVTFRAELTIAATNNANERNGARHGLSHVHSINRDTDYNHSVPPSGEHLHQTECEIEEPKDGRKDCVTNSSDQAKVVEGTNSSPGKDGMENAVDCGDNLPTNEHDLVLNASDYAIGVEGENFSVGKDDAIDRGENLPIDQHDSELDSLDEAKEVEGTNLSPGKDEMENAIDCGDNLKTNQQVFVLNSLDEAKEVERENFSPEKDDAFDCGENLPTDEIDSVFNSLDDVIEVEGTNLNSDKDGMENAIDCSNNLSTNQHDFVLNSFNAKSISREDGLSRVTDCDEDLHVEYNTDDEADSANISGEQNHASVSDDSLFRSSFRKVAETTAESPDHPITHSDTLSESSPVSQQTTGGSSPPCSAQITEATQEEDNIFTNCEIQTERIAVCSPSDCQSNRTYNVEAVETKMAENGANKTGREEVTEFKRFKSVETALCESTLPSLPSDDKNGPECEIKDYTTEEECDSIEEYNLVFRGMSDSEQYGGHSEPGTVRNGLSKVTRTGTVSDDEQHIIANERHPHCKRKSRKAGWKILRRTVGRRINFHNMLGCIGSGAFDRSFDPNMIEENHVIRGEIEVHVERREIGSDQEIDDYTEDVLSVTTHLRDAVLTILEDAKEMEHTA